MKFIVKLFPEITIKSKPVRKRFIQRLQSNLQITLKRLDNDIVVRGLWDKVEVEVPSDDAQLRLDVIELMGCTPVFNTSWKWISIHWVPLKRYSRLLKRSTVIWLKVNPSWCGLSVGVSTTLNPRIWNATSVVAC